MKFEWVVPVIVVVVWLINAIVKARENDEPVRPKRPGVGPREARNPVGDIDRFLQEIDRLRQKTAEERGAPPPAVRPVVVPRARPAPAVAPPRARPAAGPAWASIPIVEAAPVVVAAAPPAVAAQSRSLVP